MSLQPFCSRRPAPSGRTARARQPRACAHAPCRAIPGSDIGAASFIAAVLPPLLLLFSLPLTLLYFHRRSRKSPRTNWAPRARRTARRQRRRLSGRSACGSPTARCAPPHKNSILMIIFIIISRPGGGLLHGWMRQGPVPCRADKTAGPVPYWVDKTAGSVRCWADKTAGPVPRGLDHPAGDD